MRLDLNSLTSVRACAEELRSKTRPMNISIGNAGVMASPKGRTVDGFETQFGTNHIAHFLLFYLVKSLLISFSTSAFHSRAIYLSSSAHRTSSVRFDNLTL
jgi:NAD(P)-dependent dehydrogenase (short-subunit alcohol dehydrogenase family)